MKKLALFALLACAGASFAQPTPTTGWFQPWTPDLPSFESRVFDCNNPFVTSVIAMDDFTVNVPASNPLVVTAINWWGTVSQPLQLNRPYYITIYRGSAACTPDLSAQVFRACIRPKTSPVGVDCLGQQVYKFFTNLPPGILVLNSGPYWLQISEADQQSVQPGAPDFWWSSHFPVMQCQALQMFATGGMVPLFDPCYGVNVDLAFEIF